MLAAPSLACVYVFLIICSLNIERVQCGQLQSPECPHGDVRYSPAHAVRLLDILLCLWMDILEVGWALSGCFVLLQG